MRRRILVSLACLGIVLFGYIYYRHKRSDAGGQNVVQDPVKDEKEAVCKNSQIPADRVVVSEFQSDGCSPPGTNNAWDTAVPRDGTVICQKRPFDSTARVLQLEF